MNHDLTQGNITKNLLLFALPLMLGNVLQQLYNIVDTLIVGRVIGADALAAVGASYTLMTFITSIILGLCMGSGAFFSIQFGKKDWDSLHNGIFLAFSSIGILAIGINILLYLFLRPITAIFQVPNELSNMMTTYLWFIFMGIMATYLYNFFANLLRAVGNSVIPLLFLGIASVMNMGLDILFVYVFRWGIAGAAVATVISQFFSGIGIAVYAIKKCPDLRIHKKDMYWSAKNFKEMTGLSVLTSVQQSVMNFGILMVQGLVNSFGPVVMAAFATAVKIDTLAYMPVQDFGNAFSTFVAQNHGANKQDRIRRGIRQAFVSVFFFCLFVSGVVCIFASPLMSVFLKEGHPEIINVGVEYLRIEGAFYLGIGILFLLYGYFRAINRPWMSVVLTICSLGTRVALAYTLAAIPAIGVTGIWVAIPIGWFLADAVGVVVMKFS